MSGGRSDSGIDPEFRLIAGTVCPGPHYVGSYIQTLVAGMQYH